MLTKDQLVHASKCHQGGHCSRCSIARGDKPVYYCIEKIATTALKYIEILERMQYADTEPRCIICGKRKSNGHSANCKFGLIIKEISLPEVGGDV